MIQYGTGVPVRFQELCALLYKPRVLELGTLQSTPGRSTIHTDWVPNAGEFLGTDFKAGQDVDIVADIHRLSEVVGEEQFDIILSMSTFEHLKYPHLAAHEIMKVLRIDGLLFVQTHQTFALHAYPHDYFRFSREALAGLFGTKMGFNVIETEYEFPAKIVADADPFQHLYPSFLNVSLYGQKTDKTPENYIYEYDV